MKKAYNLTRGKEVWKEIEKASYGGQSRVFEDWIDMILNSLLALTDNLKRPGVIEKLEKNNLDGKYEDEYMKIVKKYSEGEKGSRPVDYMAKAWGLLYKETVETRKDILGEIYQAKITFGEHGQFFTPEHITDFMAEITGVENETVNDPCCGSGRLLISAGKRNGEARLSGIDLDNRCAKMTALNMFMFDFNSVIYWGNSLSGEMNKKWITQKGGFIYETEAENIEIRKVVEDPAQLKLFN